MENISITTYRGLSLVSGSISIRQMFEFIRGDVYRDRIRRLREAMDAGETVKADHMKKQLPYCTITATYAKERLAYSLDKYQDIITLDCDDMPAEKYWKRSILMKFWSREFRTSFCIRMNRISPISLSYIIRCRRTRVTRKKKLCCISTVSCVMLIRLMTQVHVKLLTTSSSRKNDMTLVMWGVIESTKN